VTFKLHYQTVPGEDLHVIGEISELGNLSEQKHPLKWTEGHIWMSDKALITN
jgi:hypothetical protein